MMGLFRRKPKIAMLEPADAPFASLLSTLPVRTGERIEWSTAPLTPRESAADAEGQQIIIIGYRENGSAVTGTVDQFGRLIDADEEVRSMYPDYFPEA